MNLFSSKISVSSFLANLLVFSFLAKIKFKTNLKKSIVRKTKKKYWNKWKRHMVKINLEGSSKLFNVCKALHIFQVLRKCSIPWLKKHLNIFSSSYKYDRKSAWIILNSRGNFDVKSVWFCRFARWMVLRGTFSNVSQQLRSKWYHTNYRIYIQNKCRIKHTFIPALINPH